MGRSSILNVSTRFGSTLLDGERIVYCVLCIFILSSQCTCLRMDRLYIHPCRGQRPTRLSCPPSQPQDTPDLRRSLLPCPSTSNSSTALRCTIDYRLLTLYAARLPEMVGNRKTRWRHRLWRRRVVQQTTRVDRSSSSSIEWRRTRHLNSTCWINGPSIRVVERVPRWVCFHTRIMTYLCWRDVKH